MNGDRVHERPSPLGPGSDREHCGSACCRRGYSTRRRRQLADQDRSRGGGSRRQSRKVRRSPRSTMRPGLSPNCRRRARGSRSPHMQLRKVIGPLSTARARPSRPRRPTRWRASPNVLEPAAASDSKLTLYLSEDTAFKAARRAQGSAARRGAASRRRSRGLSPEAARHSQAPTRFWPRFAPTLSSSLANGACSRKPCFISAGT